MNVRNSEKIQENWLLFQRFVTSIAGQTAMWDSGFFDQRFTGIGELFANAIFNRGSL